MVTTRSEARVLEPLGRVSARDGDESAKKRNDPTYAAVARTPIGANDAQDWGAKQVNEWLLLLLGFAVTSDAKDQSAALALADEIDARGLQWRPSAPTFFRRTTK